MIADLRSESRVKRRGRVRPSKAVGMKLNCLDPVRNIEARVMTGLLAPNCDLSGRGMWAGARGMTQWEGR